MLTPIVHRILPSTAALCALAACSSSSTPATGAACQDGISHDITVALDALDKTLPLDVRACVQTRPCQTAHVAGSTSRAHGGVAFTFTLDPKHQQMTGPVSLTITAAGQTVASGKVDVRVTQDFRSEGSSGKTADCGARALITVSSDGQLKAEQLE